jgi:hypothetical protein
MAEFGQSGYGNVPKDVAGGDRSKVVQFFFGEDQRGIKRRVLFLDGEDGMPFGFHLHSHYVRGTGRRVEEVCLLKNNLAPRCPLCEHITVSKDKETGKEKESNWYPSYVGCYTLLDMGRYVPRQGAEKPRLAPVERVYKGKTYKDQWRRKLLLLKRGGEKRPGALPKIMDMIAREFGEDLPNCKGVVCDVVRNPGDQTDRVGDDWKVVTYNDAPLRVPAEKWMDYFRSLGMTPEDAEAVQKYKQLEPINHRAMWRAKTEADLERALAVALGHAEDEQREEQRDDRRDGTGGYEATDTGATQPVGDPPEGFFPDGSDVPFGDDSIPF